MNLDAHQHFWVYDADQYPWMDGPAMTPLRRDYLPKDWEAEQARVEPRMDGSIAVQARQTLEESRWLLQLADAHPRVLGVVGWVDLRSASVRNQLEELAPHPKFVGVRHVVQDEPDDRFLLREDFFRGMGMLREFKLTYDLLVFPRQLEAAIALARRFPDQPFVLDHLAKPAIKDGVVSPWREWIRELASCPNVMCKMSGLVTEAQWGTWSVSDFTPYLDVAAEAFGEDRLMFGSDWPVCVLSGSYGQVTQLVRDYAAGWSGSARAKLFGENAASFYGVAAGSLPP